MRPVSLIGGAPANGTVEQRLDYLEKMIIKLCRASQQEGSTVADPYQITNATPVRVLDSATATTAQVAKAFSTLVQDMQRRGMNSGNG